MATIVKAPSLPKLTEVDEVNEPPSTLPPPPPPNVSIPAKRNSGSRRDIVVTNVESEPQPNKDNQYQILVDRIIELESRQVELSNHIDELSGQLIEKQRALDEKTADLDMANAQIEMLTELIKTVKTRANTKIETYTKHINDLEIKLIELASSIYSPTTHAHDAADEKHPPTHTF